MSKVTLLAFEGDGLDRRAELRDDRAALKIRWNRAEILLVWRGKPLMWPAQDMQRSLHVADLVLANEDAFRPRAETLAGLDAIGKAMDQCITRGLSQRGTLPGGLKVQRRAPDLWDKLSSNPQSNEREQLFDWLNCFAMAVNEENAAGGRVVTAPTNGAAGILPAVMRHYCCDDDGAPLRAKMQRFLLVAGGIGITPILAMADRLKALGKRYRLLYCGASRSRMALLDRVADHPATLHVTEDGTRLDLATLTAKGPVYACGPDRLLDALSTLDWDEGQLRVEYFTSGATGYDPERDHGFTVELADSELTLQVAPEQTLYDALRAAGIDVGKDCGEGLCGSCEVPVIDGEIDHRDWVLSAAERAEGRRMMSCCSRAPGGKLKLGL